jgi:replicative DNA helicase
VVGAQNLLDLPIAIEDEPAMAAAAIALRVRAAKRRFGRLALVIVDHFHIIGRPADAVRNGDTQALAAVSRGLKGIAKAEEVPLVALAQLSRAVEQREDKRPTLSDLRQTGSLEEDADAVTFIYRDDYYHKRGVSQGYGESEADYQRRKLEAEAGWERIAGKVELISEEVRDGEPGTDEVMFDPERVRFWDGGAA